MRTMIYSLLTFALLVTFACKGDEEDAPGFPDRPAPGDVTYAEVFDPPAIATVDEHDYTVYHVDSGTPGNDSNDGASESTPFKTLTKITQLLSSGTIGGKTKVLLKSGAVFNNATAYDLVLKNLNATPEKPFIVDIYGGTERPTINGTGDQAVLIQDGNVRFRNIRVTNKGGSRGIRLQTMTRGAGAMANIEITGCRIEYVNWNDEVFFEGKAAKDMLLADIQKICPDNRFNTAKEYGGIIVEAFNTQAQGAGWYENLYITNNEIFAVARTGILISNKWGQRYKPGTSGSGYNTYNNDQDGWFPCRNVVIQGNDIRYTGGDGVILMGSTDSYIDHNRCFHANFLGRNGQANAGLWPYSSSNIVMQYNEAAYTDWAHGSADGEGLDVDMSCSNTLVQFNYIHHNEGGGILLCNNTGGDHQGTIIRNNVFLNNSGGGWKGGMMTISSSVGRTDIYNNTVIMDNGANPIFLYSDDWANAGKAREISFRNNIFMSAVPSSASFDHHNLESPVFENNLFFQTGSAFSIDSLAIRYDPKITLPVSADGFERGLACRPGEARVFRDGLPLDGMPVKDIAGNSTRGIAYVGAFAN